MTKLIRLFSKWLKHVILQLEMVKTTYKLLKHFAMLQRRKHQNKSHEPH